MADSKRKHDHPVTLEQLLQLKRSERPDSAFWDKFDSELRSRQLAALVKTHPWYFRLGTFLVVAARRSAPVAAAATALAVGYFGMVRHPQAPSSSDTSNVAQSFNESPERLPVFNVSGSNEATVSPEPIQAEAHYVVDVLAKQNDSQKRFVTVASPKTLLAGADETGTYVVNALTSTPAFHASFASAVREF